MNHPHVARVSFSFVIFKSHLYLCGGLEFDNHHLFDSCPTADRPTASVLRYSLLDEGAWAEFAPLPLRKMNAAAIVIDDALYVIGGESGDCFNGFFPVTGVAKLTESTWEETLGLPRGMCSFKGAYLV